MMSSLTDRKNVVAGIDIGGSHITMGIIDLDTNILVDDFTIRKRVNSKGSAEEILSVWCDAIKELWQHYDITNCRLGMAMPGPFNYQKGISLIKGFDKFDELYQLNIREELARRLNMEGDKICFRNDAEAFLEGEVFSGAAKGYTNSIGVTLGTGFGSAWNRNGKTADAELSVVQYHGEKIEEFVSTRGIVRRYRDLTGSTLKDAKAVADLYNTDVNAVKTFKIFSEDLAWILKILIEKQQPDILVIGGSIANSWDLFIKDVTSHLSSSLANLPLIVRSKLGENGALVGGAYCFK